MAADVEVLGVPLEGISRRLRIYAGAHISRDRIIAALGIEGQKYGVDGVELLRVLRETGLVEKRPGGVYYVHPAWKNVEEVRAWLKALIS